MSSPRLLCSLAISLLTFVGEQVQPGTAVIAQGIGESHAKGLLALIGEELAQVQAPTPAKLPVAPVAPVEEVKPVPAPEVKPEETSVLKPRAAAVTTIRVTRVITYALKIPDSGPPTVEIESDVVGPQPGPVPVPPVPGNLTDFGKAIKAAADKATGDTDRANTAQGLAMLYRSISSEAHKAGTAATTETVSNTTLLVTDMALAKQGPAAVTAWADERAAMRAALVDAIQTGKTVAQMGDLLDQAAAGLEASAPKLAAQAPSPAFWDFLLKLIAMLLPLLIPKV